MALATATALQNFRPFVFGNHALHLEQELIFRGLADFAVEKDDLNACANELLQQQHLVGVVARQAIWAMDIEVIYPSSRGDISQAF